MSYELVRFYQRDDVENVVIARGLTLREAKSYCNSPDSSSESTADPALQTHTYNYGPWFVGFRKEEDE